MTRVHKGFHSFTCTARVRSLSANGMNRTCFFFPAEAGSHLPTPEGWKAELAEMGRPFAANSHVPWALNIAKMSLRPGLSRKRIFGVFRATKNG